MGPWLHPTGAWEGTIGLKFRVTLLVGMTQVRWGEGVQTNYFHRWKSVPRALPSGFSRRRRE